MSDINSVIFVAACFAVDRGLPVVQAGRLDRHHLRHLGGGQDAVEDTDLGEVTGALQDCASNPSVGTCLKAAVEVGSLFVGSALKALFTRLSR
ncbi:hypothetical protein ABZS61_17575 [Streptomyces sp. NPDC005566]|uniref:hypothetical protein n=1 Tax=Streptomyces sp. NPDC005566 TaxID=3156886 RepID=UPI0033BBA656